MTPEPNHPHTGSYFDLAFVWAMTILGQMTLEKWVLLATLAYTVLRAVVLIRDDFFRKGKSTKKD